MLFNHDKSVDSKYLLCKTVNTQHTTYRKGKMDAKANCNH